jgi:hypothetical protein
MRARAPSRVVLTSDRTRALSKPVVRHTCTISHDKLPASKTVFLSCASATIPMKMRSRWICQMVTDRCSRNVAWSGAVDDNRAGHRHRTRATCHKRRFQAVSYRHVTSAVSVIPNPEIACRFASVHLLSIRFVIRYTSCLSCSPIYLCTGWRDPISSSRV